ncbi:MAG: hypothetical protein MUE46_13680 [Xanthomonadales bacterium]|jgi:hypothetical protein|nr:hypothetical protein [Xanthomonadales bacterium]
MARYQHLPIWRSAMDSALGLEQAVAGFPRTHRYALGAELRRCAQQILGAVMRAVRPTPESQDLEALLFGLAAQKPEVASSPFGLLAMTVREKAFLAITVRIAARPGDRALATTPNSRHREARLAGRGGLAFQGARSWS